MKRTKFLSLLLVVAMLLPLVFTTPVTAAAGQEFAISNLNGLTAADGGKFYWPNGSEKSASCLTVPGVAKDTPFQPNFLAKGTLEVGGSEKIIVDTATTLGDVTISNGTLWLNSTASFAANSKIEGKSQASSSLVNYSSNAPMIRGAFTSLGGTGTVKLSPGEETSIYGGEAKVNGNGGILNVLGGTPEVSGQFQGINVNSGTVQVKESTYTKNLSFDKGKLTVAANTFFAAGGNTIRPAMETSYNNGAWGRLTKGTYNAISGEWTVTDDVEILDTQGLSVDEDSKELKQDSADVSLTVLDAKNLTVSGGTVSLKPVTGAAENEARVGNLVINGKAAVVKTPSAGKTDTYVTADSINISGGGKLLVNMDVRVRIASKQKDGSYLYPTVIQPVSKEKKVQDANFANATLTKWCELPSATNSGAIQQYNLRGEWVLPAGVTGYIGGYETTDSAELGDIAKMATVNGHGGNLNLSDVNVAAKGYFEKITTSGQFLAVPVGSTLCTENRSVRPCYNPTYEKTGDPVDKEFVKIASVKVLPSNIVPNDGEALEKWNQMTPEEQAAKAYRYADLTGDWQIEQGNYVAVESTVYTYELDGAVKYTGDNVRFSLTKAQDASVGEHDKAVVFTYTGVDGQESENVNIAKSSTAQSDLFIQTARPTVVHGNRYELDAKGVTYIDGTFTNITGEVWLLEGDGEPTETIILGTTAYDPAGKVLVHGNGQILTIKGGAVEVEGEFDQLVDATGAEEHKFEDHETQGNEGGIHIEMKQNLTLNKGICGIVGANPDSTLTVRGTAFVHAQGVFKKMHVYENGTLVDCGSITAKNIGDAALVVEDRGTVIFDHNTTSVSASSETIPINTVDISGGSCTFLSGSIEARANSAKAVNVSGGMFTLGYDRDITGADAEYRKYMASKPNQSASSFYGAETEVGLGGHLMPKISVNGDKNRGIFAQSKGEVFIRAGEIVFNGGGSYGVSAESGGNVHIYPNDRDGRDDVTLPFLVYIHGGLNSERAMDVGLGGIFDIRGRGALLEEPRTSGETMPYALFVDERATIGSRKPLGGGTFMGKVVYDKNNVYDLLDYNSYVRYDGIDAPNYDATDGTYGIHPSFNQTFVVQTETLTAADDAKTNPEKLGAWINMHQEDGFIPDGYTFYNVGRYDTYRNLKVINCFGRSIIGHPDQYYSVADAEWELRRNMADENAGYQIPVGMGCDKNTLYLDGNSYDGSGWANTVKGDVDVFGEGHALYLAGRVVEFNGKTTDGSDLTASLGKDLFYRGENSFECDSNTAFAIHVNLNSALTVRDCIFGEDGTDRTIEDCNGGFVGTGAVKYSSFEDAKRDTGVIYSEGALDLVSGQFLADEAGFRAGGIRITDGVTNVGGFLHSISEVAEEPEQESGQEPGQEPEQEPEQEPTAEQPSTENEDNSNQILVIRGGSDEGYDKSSDPSKIRSKNIYLLPAKMGADTLGTINIYGGVIGALENSGCTAAILNDAGTVNVYGGILTGDGTYGEGIISRTDRSVTKVNGGCIYSDYGVDNYNNAYGSVDLRKGTVFLNIDAVHSAGAYAGGAVGYITDVPEEKKTAATHHLDNVKVSGGALYIGSDEILSGAINPADVRGLTHINGNLECSGGLTVVYDGIVAGDTIVSGAVQSPFDTKFFARDGDFGRLFVKDHDAVTQPYSYRDKDGTGFENYVRIHGGTYASIDLKELHTEPAVISAQELFGSWTDQLDFDDNASTDNWTMFNHYASAESAIKRDENHRWSEVPAAVSDPDRAVNGKVLTPEEDGGIVVRDAAKEFIVWAGEKDGGSYGQSYALPVNILLGENNMICDPYFFCTDGRTLPVEIKGGIHNLDTNNFAISGVANGALLQQTAGTTTITNSNAATDAEICANQIRNFSTAKDTAVMQVESDATVNVTVDACKPVILRAYDMGADVRDGATFSMKGSTAIGDRIAGIKTAGQTKVDADSTVHSYEGNGITAISGAVAICANTEVQGKLCGVEAQNAASVKVRAAQEQVAAIIGETKDGVRMGTGKLDADYAEITGKDYGVFSEADVILDHSKVDADLHEGVNTSADVQAAESEISGHSGIIANGNVTITGKSTVIGEKFDGIESKKAVTLTGDTDNCVTVTGKLQAGVKAKTLDAAYATITGNASGTELVESVKLKNSHVTSVNPNSAQGGVLVTEADGASEIIDSVIEITDRSVSLPTLQFLGKNGGAATLTMDGTVDGEGNQISSIGDVVIQNATVYWKNGKALDTVNISGKELEISGGEFEKEVTANSEKMTLSGGEFQENVTVDGEKMTLSGGLFQKNVIADSGEMTLSGGDYQNFMFKSGKATVTGGTFNGTFTQEGAETELKASAGKNKVVPHFNVFEKQAGKAQLLAGTYNKIITDDESLLVNITGSAKDATNKPLTVTKYVLQNNKTLEGIDYDSDGKGTMVTYAAPFTLSSTATQEPSAPSGGGGGGGGGGAFVENTYDVTVKSTKNGEVKADRKNVATNQTVTITVVPDKGYTTETVTVKDKNGKEVAVKDIGDNKYSFKMPVGGVSVSSTFTEENTMLNFFVDVKATDYYYDAVLWAAENEITTGTDDVHFSPDADVTRGQVVTFLWRAAGSPKAKSGTGKFTDVKTDSYYAEAIAWAVEQGITNGTSKTAFSPDDVCSRGQIVTFLARFAGVKDATTKSTFTDVKSTDYFAAAVEWAKENKVTEGTSATTFSPNEDCTRAQIVTFLYRWMVK